MVAKTFTVTFEGIEARLVEVQCAVTPGLPAFTIVGLADKAISESRERVKAALAALAIALPAKRVTLNLSPADLPKEGPHFDLPIALALLAALGALPADAVEQVVSMGELALDGRLIPVLGTLPAALAAAQAGKGLICPQSSAPEAAWASPGIAFGARGLGDVVNHLSGRHPIAAARARLPAPTAGDAPDLMQIRGQEQAKRALEIAAAGRHNLLLIGPPGVGKSMLAKSLPGIMPPLSPHEVLESSMVHSLAGLLQDGQIRRQRPFRAPHHSATQAAMIGGARHAKPGEIALAHHGVLFLDELPEFPRVVLESLRQPIENGEVLIARAQAHLRYPCRFLLIAAANPCRCGHLMERARQCGRAPLCGADYLGKISGPLLDRFDLRVELAPVSIADLESAPRGEPTHVVAQRVEAARARQAARYHGLREHGVNADLSVEQLDRFVALDPSANQLMRRAAEKFSLSARGYHRILRVARTIADLDGTEGVTAAHLAEALGYRSTLVR